MRPCPGASLPTQRPSWASHVAAVDFTDLAQSCRTYGEFIEKMARTGPGELRYLGMALLGPRHQVDRLTGSLPLLR